MARRQRFVYDCQLYFLLACVSIVACRPGKPYEIRLLNSHGPCDFVNLIRCFVNALDDWAWSLFTIKDNIAMVEGDGCRHHRELGNCVFYEGCSRVEILEASNLVSELLAHRRGATSFLKSYFLADFSCSEEGQVIVTSHRDCLLKEHIGDQAIEASTYLEHKLHIINANNTDNSFHDCELLRERAELMYRIGEEECPPAGGLLMCRSLIDSFVYLYPNRFEYCDVTCNVPKSTSLPMYHDDLGSDHLDTEHGLPINQGELNGPKGNGAFSYHLRSHLLTAVLVALLAR